MKSDSVKLIFFLICASSFILACSANRNTKGQSKNIGDFNDQNRVIGEYIVTFKNDVGRDILYDLFASYKVVKIEIIRDNISLITLEIDPGIETIRSEFLGKKGISDIQPNYKYRLNPPKERRIKIKPE